MNISFRVRLGRTMDRCFSRPIPFLALESAALTWAEKDSFQSRLILRYLCSSTFLIGMLLKQISGWLISDINSPVTFPDRDLKKFSNDRTADRPIYFRDRNFSGQKVSRFSRFLHFSRKFLPRHNLNSEFAKVFAQEITENARHAKVFSIQFFFRSSICCVAVP